MIFTKIALSIHLSGKKFIHIARNVKEMRKYYKDSQINSMKTFGFVPTMGALHSGHLSLMKQAKQENDIAIASIFVNPTQFSAGEDFDKYPRDLNKDIELLKSIEMDCIFAPETSEMYPPSRLCHVEPSEFSQIYEGKARPEFFRGVATIVCKLFNIIQPTTTYFGQKDVSQCILVRKMVEDLNMPVEVKVIETIRDTDGLALSSRNAYLSTNERNVSNILYKGLSLGKTMIEKSSNTIEAKTVVDTIRQAILQEPLVKKIEYISIASYLNMKELDQISLLGTGAVISSAIRLGNVRLIDNVLVGKANNLLSK